MAVQLCDACCVYVHRLQIHSVFHYHKPLLNAVGQAPNFTQLAHFCVAPQLAFVFKNPSGIVTANAWHHLQFRGVCGVQVKCLSVGQFGLSDEIGTIWGQVPFRSKIIYLFRVVPYQTVPELIAVPLLADLTVSELIAVPLLTVSELICAAQPVPELIAVPLLTVLTVSELICAVLTVSELIAVYFLVISASVLALVVLVLITLELVGALVPPILVVLALVAPVLASFKFGRITCCSS